MFDIMRTLCGRDWKPTEALFAHRKSEDVEPYRPFFDMHVRFDAEQYGLFFRGLVESVSGQQRP